jgi:hypothetical protein
MMAAPDVTSSSRNMTTESPRIAPIPPKRKSDLRPHLTTLLAMVYLTVWWAFGGRTPQSSAASAPEPAAVPLPTQAPPPIWYGDLPLTSRPKIQLPSGWQIAPLGKPPARVVDDAPPAPVRVAPARVGRVRTRSS